MKNLFTLFTLLILTLTIKAQVPQTVIVEHFTNTRCGICSSRNPALFNVLGQNKDVLHIAYHPSSPYSSCKFSQHNKNGNDDRTKYYGIYGGTPKVILNGAKIPSANPMVSNAQLATEKAKTSNYSVKLMQGSVNSDTRSIDMMVKREAGMGSQNLLLTVVIVEKLVKYDAPNGEKEHHNVFRKKLDEYKIDLQNMGDSFSFSTTFDLNNEWKDEEVYVIATLENAVSKEILQAAASNLVQSSSIKESINAEYDIYPNPSSGNFNLSNALIRDFERIDVYNLVGEKVLSKNISDAALNIDIENGYYFVQFISASGLHTHTEKVLIRK